MVWQKVENGPQAAFAWGRHAAARCAAGGSLRATPRLAKHTSAFHSPIPAPQL